MAVAVRSFGIEFGNEFPLFFGIQICLTFHNDDFVTPHSGLEAVNIVI